jgi:hypothetical protein
MERNNPGFLVNMQHIAIIVRNKTNVYGFAENVYIETGISLNFDDR